MAYHEFLLVFTLMGMHSVCSLVEIDPAPSVLSCKKCPPGFLSSCKQPQTSLCLPCEEGTYSENPSRRSACKPCSSCHSNEFEWQPCTPTSNVKCKKCSKCAPGFWEVKPCGRTRDTVCEECPQYGQGIMSYASVQCNEVGIEDHLILKKRKGSDKAKSSLTIIEKEIPWSDDKRRPPKHHDHKFTIEKQHLNVSSSSLGFPSRDQALSSSSSTNRPASTQMAFSSHSVVLVSPSVEASSISISGLPKSISPSLAPTKPAKRRSPPPPPNVPRTKPAAKTNFEAITKEPSSHEMQGDQGDIPSRHTRRTDQNINITAGSSKQRAASSVSPSKYVVTVDMFDLNARGVVEGHTSTEFIPHHTLSGTVLRGEMPVPTNTNKSRQSHRGIIAVAVGVVTVLAVLLFVGWRQFRKTKECFKCPQPTFRRPRCPATSDFCDGNSVSSTATSYAEQNQMGNSVDHGCPVTLTIEHESDESPPSSNTVTQHTYLPSERTVVVADVHHDTVFNLFNLREQVDGAARLLLKYITRAETTINSSGGKLTSPDSDISIIVDSGAVREGINQPFSFHVVYDETSLLRDIPEGPHRTLICPVFHCGPDNISLLKPVEIIVPHCLYLDEVKKGSISVYRCGTHSDDGPLKWEKVPSASEKNSQSKAWYTVKKDSVHIKTKSFSFWSIFLCGGGGPKRKRATVFASQPNEELNTICYRFYIYSDNKDSKRRVLMKERELCPNNSEQMNSQQMNEVPFKMYNDAKDIIVRLSDLEKGWEMDKTPITQTYTYETAYHNGFRTCTSREFAVKPCQQIVEAFSCMLKFQQEEHPPEHTIYLRPVFTPRENTRRFSVSHSTTVTGSRISVVREEDEGIDDQNNKPSPDIPASQLSNHCFSSLGSDDEPVTQSHCHCISPLVGGDWKNVLRYLGVEEVPTIENVDRNYSHESVEEKCYQGLLMWMRNSGPQTATTKKLCNALRKTSCTEALEELSKAGVRCVPPVSITESTADQPGASV